MTRHARKLASFLLVALTGVSGISVADGETSATITDCRPIVSVGAIDGQDPSLVAPPNGYTSRNNVTLSVTVGHEGESCPNALNEPPQLASPWVSLVWGHAYDGVTYRVTYIDADGDAPAFVRVLIDGIYAATMNPVAGSTLDYRAGVTYSAGAPSRLRPGNHSHSFEASDSFGTVSTPTIDGPRIVDIVTGTLDQANPANRIVIHPVANGPTLVPPTELPPPSLPVLGSPAQGVTSIQFDLDPQAANGKTEGVLSQLGGIEVLFDPGFETGFGGEAQNLLLGGAQVSLASRTGSFAVNLAPTAAIPDENGFLSGIDLASRPESALAQLSSLEFWYLRDPPGSEGSPADLHVQLQFPIDANYDSAADACIIHSSSPPAFADWTLHAVTTQDLFEVRDAACTAPLARPESASGQVTLKEIQDNPLWGHSRILDVRLLARLEPGSVDAWPADASFVIDDLFLESRSTSDADFDACFYPAAPATSPISCISDIGPHQGTIPEGTRRVNVWADSLLPSGLVFDHPYIEPASFWFLLIQRSNPPTAPAPAQSSAVGSLLIMEDVNGDGDIDPMDVVLAQGERILASVADQNVDLDLLTESDPEGAVRADGVLSLLIQYENGLPASRPGLLSTIATEPFEIARFVNDSPTASLAASQQRPLGRRVEFHLVAGDPDDAQGPLSANLGGFQVWSLDFGDGSPPLTGASASALIEHKYSRGSFTATLTATDRQGAIAICSVTVEVVANYGEQRERGSTPFG